MNYSKGYISFILIIIIVFAILLTAGSFKINNPLNNTSSPTAGGLNRAQIADVLTQHLATDLNGYYNKIRPNPFSYPGSNFLVQEDPPNPPPLDDSTDLEGYIYCSTLALDVFNISGINVPHNLLDVNNMIDYWKNTKGFNYIDYWTAKNSGSVQQEQAMLSQVKLGDAIWYANTGYCGSVAFCHTGIVYSVNINSNGDGIIETREANNTVTSIKLPVSSWYILNYPDAGSFGGVN